MESSQHVDPETDLTPVFGEPAADELAQVREQLALADGRLQELRDRLGEGWTTAGLVLETLPSGQASISGEVRAGAGDLWFRAELRPRNYFSEQNPWRPGQPPRPMQTDAWDVDGVVQVVVSRHVLNKKYKIEETGAEIEEQRFGTAPEAAAGLLAAVAGLSELASSREPAAAAWTPEAT